MMTPTGPLVECDQQHASVFVTDLGVAIDFYTQRLGFTLAFTWGDPPRFAGVNLDRGQIFLDQRPPDPNGCCLFFNVWNIDELYDFHRANGVEVVDRLATGRGTCAITPSAISTATISSSGNRC